MKSMLAGIFLAGALTAAVPRVEAGELSTLLDLSLRFSERGFTLDARVDGPHGPTTGSVKGRLRDDGGMGLNGWVDDRGKCGSSSWTPMSARACARSSAARRRKGSEPHDRARPLVR